MGGLILAVTTPTPRAQPRGFVIIFPFDGLIIIPHPLACRTTKRQFSTPRTVMTLIENKLLRLTKKILLYQKLVGPRIKSKPPAAK